MKASLSTRLLYLTWRGGLALLERLYVRPSRVVRAVADSLVSVGPLALSFVLGQSLICLLGASAGLFAWGHQTWASTTDVGKAGLVALAGLACVVVLVGSFRLLWWLCSPFLRFHDPDRRPELIRLLEQAYPGVELPICCTTRWEAWLVRFVFSEENQSRHRERALAVTLPAPVRAAQKPRF